MEGNAIQAFYRDLPVLTTPRLILRKLRVENARAYPLDAIGRE